MQLIIDNREPNELISLLKSRIENVTLGNLNLGDIIFKNDNGDMVLIFERKSLSDLIASIKDGRYNEQSFRLSECETDNRNIYYIIEGNIMNFCNKNNETLQKMLFSSMLSLSHKKGFSLLHTSNLIETAEFIIRFYEKLKANKGKKECKKEDKCEQDKGTKEECKNEECKKEDKNEECKKEDKGEQDKGEQDKQNNVKYSEVVKSVKKANITKDNINEIMLSSIPGISVIVASELMKEYKTINNLINKLLENNNCLENFKINFKNGERKIGKNIINNIKIYLL